MKRFLPMLLALCLLCSFLPSFALAEEPALIVEGVLTEEDILQDLGEEFIEFIPEELENGMDEPFLPEYVLEEEILPAEPGFSNLEENLIEEQMALEMPDYTNEKSTRGFVYRMYKVVLGREPDTAGLNYWVNALNSGSQAAGNIVDAFFNSGEYQGRGNSNDKIVRDCYQAMLSRTPDSEGLAWWKNRLDIGMTSQAICAGFVGSDEFRKLSSFYGIQPGAISISNARDLNYDLTFFVYRLYENCLGRKPDTAGQEGWCSFLSSGGEGTAAAEGFLFSDELYAKHLCNSDFVDLLYQSILGRKADKAGKSGWADQLNYTSTREHVTNGFLFSNEFRQQCSAAGITLGRAIEEPDQTVEWQNNIRMLSLCNEVRTAAGLAKLMTREDLWRDVAMKRSAYYLAGEDAADREDNSGFFGRIVKTYQDAGMKINGIQDTNEVSCNLMTGDASSVFTHWIDHMGLKNLLTSSRYTYAATGFLSEYNEELSQWLFKPMYTYAWCFDICHLYE